MNRLEARKALLRLRIAERRLACAEAGAELAEPIALIDRGWLLWKRISPFVKALGVPAAMLLGKKLFRRGTKVASWARFLPLALQAFRFVVPKRPAAAPASASSQ